LNFKNSIFVILITFAANLCFAVESGNLLQNGSFEMPVISEGTYIENPMMPGWTIDNAYSVLFKTGGVTPADGLNEFYIFNGDVRQSPVKIKAGWSYNLHFWAAVNEMQTAPAASYAVLEAVDISNEKYELARISFSDFVESAYQWYQANISFTCPVNSFYALCTLQVRFHSGGMVHLDNVVLNASSCEIIFDDFEKYEDVNSLRNVWKDRIVSVVSGSSVSIENDFENRYSGRQSLLFAYDNSDSAKGYYSQIEYDVLNSPFGGNWQSTGLTKLCLNFRGNRINDVNESVYLIVKDISNNCLEVRYPYSAANFSDEKWHNWIIDVGTFQNGGVDIANVSKLYIGFDDNDSANRGYSPGGKGIVYFDDIKLTNNCKSDRKFAGDFTSDGKVNFEDIVLLGSWWLSEY